jgi:hypothetical protein
VTLDPTTDASHFEGRAQAPQCPRQNIAPSFTAFCFPLKPFTPGNRHPPTPAESESVANPIHIDLWLWALPFQVVATEDASAFD